jgi:hypothetical protein
MIQIINTPPTLALSNNPMRYTLRFTDNNGEPYRSRGAGVKLEIISGSFVQDDSVIVVLSKPLLSNPINYVFICRNTPNLDNEFLPSSTINNLLEKIQKHHQLGPLTTAFLHNATGITIETLSQDQGWVIDITVISSIATTTKATYLPAQNNLPVDYKALINLIFEKSLNQGDWEIVFNGELYPDEKGIDTEIYVNNVLTAVSDYIQPQNPFIEYSRTGVTITKNLKRYYANFEERNNTGIVGSYQDTIRAIITGGIANRIWYASDFLGSINQTNSFLTYQPNAKKVIKTGVEWITWFNYTGEIKTIQINVKRYFKDGTFSDAPVLQAENEIPPYFCATLSVSPNVFGLNDTVSHYEIYVKDDNNVRLSPTRTYIIDYDRWRNIRQLAYLNTFGAPEVVTCFGALTQSVKIKAQNFEQTTKIGDYILKENRREVDGYEFQYTYRSGHLDSDFQEAYTEMALSNVLYDVTTPQYLGLVLMDTREEPIRDTRQKIQSWAWNIKPRIQEENYSPDALLRLAGNLPNNNTEDLSIGGVTYNPTQQEVYIRYRTVINVATLNNLATNGQLVFPAIYYISATQQMYFAPNANSVELMGGGSDVQITRESFTLSPGITSFTVQGFPISANDPKVLIFFGGTLRNEGEAKDYTIGNGNIVTWRWSQISEEIKGEVIKISIT